MPQLQALRLDVIIGRDVPSSSSLVATAVGRCGYTWDSPDIARRCNQLARNIQATRGSTLLTFALSAQPSTARRDVQEGRHHRQSTRVLVVRQ